MFKFLLFLSPFLPSIKSSDFIFLFTFIEYSTSIIVTCRDTIVHCLLLLTIRSFYLFIVCNMKNKQSSPIYRTAFVPPLFLSIIQTISEHEKWNGNTCNF